MKFSSNQKIFHLGIYIYLYLYRYINKLFLIKFSASIKYLSFRFYFCNRPCSNGLYSLRFTRIQFEFSATNHFEQLAVKFQRKKKIVFISIAINRITLKIVSKCRIKMLLQLPHMHKNDAFD